MSSTVIRRVYERVDSVLRGALLSYRALFSWLNPLGYLSSRLVRPVGLAVTLTAAFSHNGGTANRMIVGASLMAGVGAVLYGMALSVGNERSFGTLETWLSSPQDKLGAVAQRAVPHVLDGIVGGLFTYLACCLLYRTLPLPPLVFLALLVGATVSSVGCGLVLAAAALVIEDLFIAPNIGELVLMLFSGALIPPDRLPHPLRPVTEMLPVTHLMRLVDDRTQDHPHTAAAFAGEALVGACWFAAGAIVLSVLARRASHRVSA